MVVNDSCMAPCRLSGKPVESIRGARRRRELHAHFDASNGRRAAMIKDVMVPVDGTAADEERLAAASQIAEVFNSQIIGLFLNVLPVMIVPEDGIGAPQAAELLQKAREAADRMEPRLIERLARLQRPMQLRRFDILEDAVGKVAAREARTADIGAARRPRGRHFIRLGPPYFSGETSEGHVQSHTRRLEWHAGIRARPGGGDAVSPQGTRSDSCRRR
jgi:nucleotide-binding universal stress UspA family protein